MREEGPEKHTYHQGFFLVTVALSVLALLQGQYTGSDVSAEREQSRVQMLLSPLERWQTEALPVWTQATDLTRHLFLELGQCPIL